MTELSALGFLLAVSFFCNLVQGVKILDMEAYRRGYNQAKKIYKYDCKQIMLIDGGLYTSGPCHIERKYNENNKSSNML